MGFNSLDNWRWINKKGHLQGICWTLCSCFFSNLCDTIVRLVGGDLPAMQITFFRLFFGTLIILPALLYKGKTSFVVKDKIGHLARIIIGFGAIACWISGASQTSLPSVTTISFSCPIIVLPLAYLFLGEKSDYKRVVSVILGFIGVIIVAFFESNDARQTIGSLHLHSGIVFLFFGALLFAMSDILNKKMLASEGFFSLLFYFYFGTAIISFFPALLVWESMKYEEIFYLAILGISGVLVLFCILKAAKATEISSISTYKYVELIFSIIVGYILFKDIVKISTILGASLIIPSACLIAYHEINKEKMKVEIETL